MESRHALGSKLVDLDEAASICETHRDAGLSVVLAHGVFDLLHIGHLRHFKLANQEGDVLVVSLTADSFVNKGPGRPVFPEQLRAEMVAALDMVDLVLVSHAPSAIPVIKALQPDVYIKGAEYSDEEGDVTGKITHERQAVEDYGGRIVFTEDIVSSSSSLANRFFDIYDPPLRSYLNKMRDKGGLGDILAALQRVSNCRVLMIGDAIIDEYRYVRPMGKSPKENMIATRALSSEVFAGGVLAAANHVASFCKSVDIITCLGADDTQEELIHSSLNPNVTLHSVTRPGAPTTRKSRFVDPNYVRKLFEVYSFEDAPLPADIQEELDGIVAGLVADFDLVIITDFGHGMLAQSTIDIIQKHARFLAVNAQTNSANHGFNLVTKYSRADYVCIDRGEAQLAMSDRHSPTETIVKALAGRIGGSQVMVTMAKEGCMSCQDDGTLHHVPAFSKSVVDTVGAGDAFLAVTAPLVSQGVPLDLVGFIGNSAGAMKVQIIGHRKFIEKAPLIKYVTALLK